MFDVTESQVVESVVVKCAMVEFVVIRRVAKDGMVGAETVAVEGGWEE